MSDQSKGKDKGIEKGKSEKGAGKSMSESGGQDKGMEKGKSEKGNTMEPRGILQNGKSSCLARSVTWEYPGTETGSKGKNVQKGNPWPQPKGKGGGNNNIENGKGNHVDKGKGTNGSFYKGYTKGEKGDTAAKGSKASGFWVWVEHVPYVNSIPTSFEEGEESELDDDVYVEDHSLTGVWTPNQSSGTGDTGGAYGTRTLVPVVEVSDDDHVTPAKRAREPDDPGHDSFVSYWR